MSPHRFTTLIAAVAVLVCHLHCVAHHAWGAVSAASSRAQSHIDETPYSPGNQGACDNVSGCICKGAVFSPPVQLAADVSTQHVVDFFVFDVLRPVEVHELHGLALPAFHPPSQATVGARLALLSSFRC